MKKRSLGLFGLCIVLVLGVPKMVLAGLSEWLLWGGVAATVVGVITIFTPAAPVAPVLGAVEVVGIVGGVLTHPATQGVLASNTRFNAIEEKIMITEFLLTDLAMLEVPSGEDVQYAYLYSQANVVITEFNEFRQHMEDGSDDPVIAIDLYELGDSISILADEIEFSGLDMVVSADEMNDARESIEVQGLPSFELEHLVNSGYSDDAIITFTNLHADASPDGGGFTEPTSLSDAVRNVANRFVEIAVDLTEPDSEVVPGVAVVEVIIATPQ